MVMRVCCDSSHYCFTRFTNYTNLITGYLIKQSFELCSRFITGKLYRIAMPIRLIVHHKTHTHYPPAPLAGSYFPSDYIARLLHLLKMVPFSGSA